LTSSLRTDIRDSILSRELGPAQIAVLTTTDLASKERLEELEKAKQEFLEQHVKGKGDGPSTSAIRLGRDGFEKVEDRREVELRDLRRVEEQARVVERKASIDAMAIEAEATKEDTAPTPVPLPVTSQPPTPTVPTLHRRSESINAPPAGGVALSPVKSNFALKSAWGGGGDEPHQSLDLSFGDDQAVDLSDIPMAEEEISAPFVPEEKDEWAELLRKPVVWSGGVSYVSRFYDYIGS
jgi:hypothetical protein